MDFDRETFKLVVYSSGFTKSEIGKVFQVSRQHVYALMADATPHNQESIRRINVGSSALKTLIDKGVLPLRAADHGVARSERIQAVIKKLYDLAHP